MALPGFSAGPALAPLDKGVAVSGKVMVRAIAKPVQHPAGGIVERIEVRDGEGGQRRPGAATLEGNSVARAVQSLRSQYLGFPGQRSAA